EVEADLTAGRAVIRDVDLRNRHVAGGRTDPDPGPGEVLDVHRDDLRVRHVGRDVDRFRVGLATGRAELVGDRAGIGAVQLDADTARAEIQELGLRDLAEVADPGAAGRRAGAEDRAGQCRRLIDPGAVGDIDRPRRPAGVDPGHLAIRAGADPRRHLIGR